MARPRKPIMTTAKSLKIFRSILNIFTIAEMVSVKNAKLIIIPRTIPSGLLWLFPATDEDKIMGNTGQMHGARMVMTPDKNENKSKSTIH
jgi:hypothetical protein